MDIFAHWLWVFGICKSFKFCRKQNAFLATLFAVLPDIISFLPVMIYGAYLLVTFQFPFDNPYVLSIARGDFSIWAVKASYYLYLIMHSYFFAAFALLITRRIEVWGWFAHITIDIFTHSADFNPTRFLWPFSTYYFNGIKWSDLWFLAVNWLSLTILYYYLIKTKRVDLRKIYKYFKSII